MHGRKFTREFKLDVCRQMESGAKRPGQICAEFGLAAPMVSVWRSEFKARGENAFTSKQLPPPPATASDCKCASPSWSGSAAIGAGEHAFKKVRCCVSLTERHRMIAQCQHDHPAMALTRLCRMLNLSRSWYYARPAAVAPTEEQILLRDAIERIVMDFPGSGYRRVSAQLKREGWQVNHKRVLGVMRAECLLCQLKKRFVVTTDSDHAHRTYQNLLKSWFPYAATQAWVADITCRQDCPRVSAFLAVLLDAFSRRCVGYCLSQAIDTALTLSRTGARHCAARPSPGLIRHSDRGVQYASRAYTAARADGSAAIDVAAGQPL